MRFKKIILLIILITIILLLALFLIRLFSPRQIDDVSPDIQCDKELLQKSDILYIIPSFNNNNISNNKEWCNEILALNKTLALHGYHHKYNEFLEDKNDNYLEESINVFKQCFNETPKEFKPPQLAISDDNKKLIQKHNLKLKIGFNQITHKVYHCKDTGKFPNWIIDLI
jgi:predicted deacetylase